jgi:hypothetical protein
MCFCPESAMAANHVPRFAPRRNAKIFGLSPLLSRWYPPISSKRCVYIRNVSGGRPAITNTHASHT